MMVIVSHPIMEGTAGYYLEMAHVQAMGENN